MTQLAYTEVELTEDEMSEYLSVALANGFSKGTANVSPEDMKKLRPILNKYRKSAHPFTECVRDNRKRFGPATEKFCAVIKDLIEGTTHWRNKKKGLSETTLQAMFGLEPSDEFFYLLTELSESDIDSMLNLNEVDLSDEPSMLAEMYFASEHSDAHSEDGLLWKTILREGSWKISPGPGGVPQKKTLVVRADGSSSADNMTISMSELKENFEKGVVQHVTIPTSHKDSVLENTGFIRELRISKDEQGRSILEAGMEFGDSEIKEKVKSGIIANVSSGVLFDYVNKEDGSKFNAVLKHAALTNSPWITGMKPFGVEASDNFEIVGFSEENENPAGVGGGESMSEMTLDLSELGFESAEDLKAALAERATLRARDRQRDVEDRCKSWQEDGKTPALITEAKAIMMADDGQVILTLSEEGAEKSLTATDIVERLVNKTVGVKLEDDPVSEQGLSEDQPKDDEEAELPAEVKLLASQIFFSEDVDYESAVSEAKRRLDGDK